MPWRYWHCTHRASVPSVYAARCTAYIHQEDLMTAKTVLVSGASIAGPTMAYWLRRYGLRPTVVEVAPGPRPGGQAVDLRGAAKEVADRMGVLPQVRAAL